MKKRIIPIILILVGICLLAWPYVRKDRNKLQDPTLIKEPSSSELGITEKSKEGPIVDPPTATQQVLDLQEINKDVIGIITVDQTDINYPVVQGEDNDFYLHHNLEGQEDVAGTIFLDYECQYEPLGDHQILYGHHMKNGSMFTDICLFKDSALWEDKTFIHLHTLTHSHTYELVASAVLDLTNPDDVIPFHVYPQWNEEFDAKYYVDQLKDEALVWHGEDIKPKDQLITLVTCTYETGDARFILVGRHVPTYIVEQD